MELKTYLLQLSEPERQTLASRCETSFLYLRKIAYGLKRAGEKLAIAIERETNRAVTCEELRPDVDWAYLRGTAPIHHPDDSRKEE